MSLMIKEIQLSSIFNHL